MRGNSERGEPGQRHPSRTRMYTGLGDSVVLKHFLNVFQKSQIFCFESKPHYMQSSWLHTDKRDPGYPDTQDPPSASQVLDAGVSTDKK